MKLTQRRIEGLICPAGKKDKLAFDDDQKGLAVRVTASGGKTYLAQYSHAGKKHCVPLGTGDAISLVQARLAARAIMGDVAKGRDPATERKEKALAAKRKKAHDALTVGKLVGDWEALHLVNKRPRYAFEAPRAIRSVFKEYLDWPAAGLSHAMERINRVEPTGIEVLDFVQRAANDALALSKRVKEAIRDTKSPVTYPPFEFSQSLKLVAQMIAAELPARVYYLSLTGFDTHAAQRNRHAALLQELSQGLATFHRDLKARGQLDRTLVLTFSEFGRRVAENKSGGTDHGTANVMFLSGGPIRAGLHGARPDLAALDDSGDLVHQVDFRSVYAAVLRDWFGTDAARVLHGPFEPFPVLRSGASSV